MVTEWGMSEKVGPISYGSDKEVFIGRDMASHVSYSEQTAAIIDQEIRVIIDEALQKARKLLAENKKLLDNMARLLVERETIFTEEVDMLMEGKSVEEIMAFMDENAHTLNQNPFDRASVIVKEKDLKKDKKEKTESEDGERAEAEKVETEAVDTEKVEESQTEAQAQDKDEQSQSSEQE